jgi:hypothetical protein
MFNAQCSMKKFSRKDNGQNCKTLADPAIVKAFAVIVIKVSVQIFRCHFVRKGIQNYNGLRCFPEPELI